jgi:hypothetical protein
MSTQPQDGAPTGADRAFTDTRGFKVMRTVIDAMNPLMRRILRSRYAGRMGRSLLLLRFRGRTSGRWFETPVGYAREGNRVVMVTSPTYRWWRNLVGGADVAVRLADGWYEARARVLLPDDPAYDDAVALQVRARGPRMLTGFGLTVDAEGRVPPEARAHAPEKAHIVLVEVGGRIAAPPRP